MDRNNLLGPISHGLNPHGGVCEYKIPARCQDHLQAAVWNLSFLLRTCENSQALSSLRSPWSSWRQQLCPPCSHLSPLFSRLNNPPQPYSCHLPLACPHGSIRSPCSCQFLHLLKLFFTTCAFQKDLDLLFSLFYSHQNTEQRDRRVHSDGSRCRALGDHPAPPSSLRGQERTLRVCALQASPGPGMWCFPACHCLLHHHQGGITAKASDPVCPASYRKTVGLNAHEFNCVE